MSKEKKHDRQAEMIEDGYRLRSIIDEHWAGRIEQFDQLRIMETIFEEKVEIKKKRHQMGCFRSRGDQKPKTDHP